ncbi:gephyrin-like molybdotransferase Glp [Magnetospirillum aberrantis]|uniref:Molybdopterin molybdenumtransferase n=1 Tax=Magnetospirillum aberrantis SpK TaxID=908842 RepID=A0A7C9QRR1_9PROT|nr:gephyrin-like molybdotransferase Glp [Magnetospirillum aberrantis]NFV79020.1 molybdopterin molybdotransferase MoeA [Magnetospirillum aberrantis SpK]
MTDFTVGTGMLRVEEALTLLSRRVAVLDGVEEVCLADALGRVLAEDVVSPLDVPPHANSAVDGWGFAAAGRPADGRMTVAGTVAAGHPFVGAVPVGMAVRILTGAPVPDGVDCVAMQEDCSGEGGVVTAPMLAPGTNVRAQGEDVAQGATVLAAGIRLRPQDLGLAAATGRTRLVVRRRLRAAVFSTGDEINEPGAPLPPGGIYDTNRTTACSLLRSLGAEVTDLGILPDRREVIRDALARAATGHDLILTSGGVSVGDEDHVKAAVEACGSLHFWKMAIKPGKPVALGRVGAAAFVGLPGNPVAVMVTFLLVARPLVLGMMGIKDSAVPRYRVEAGFAFRRKPGRREWLRARVRTDDGRLVAEKFPSDGSGVLTSMVWSDGLVELPEDVAEVSPGDALAYVPYAEMLR